MKKYSLEQGKHTFLERLAIGSLMEISIAVFDQEI